MGNPPIGSPWDPWGASGDATHRIPMGSLGGPWGPHGTPWGPWGVQSGSDHNNRIRIQNKTEARRASGVTRSAKTIHTYRDRERDSGKGRDRMTERKRG